MIQKLQRHFWAILIIAVIISVGTSYFIGINQGVWFDEGYSLIISKQSTAEMIRLTSVDVHPPLYYLLLQGWAHIFNSWDVILRLLSALLMGGAVLFGGMLSKKLFGKREALFVLPFLILCPMLLRYGFELRMYSLAALIGVAATYVLVCAVGAKNTKKRLVLYIIYALLVAAGMYTHYYMALLWMAHFVWLVWQSIKNKQPVFRSQWFMAYVISVILFIPWMPAFINQFMGGVLASVVQPMTIENLIGVLSFTFLYKPVWQLNALDSLLVVFVASAIGMSIYKAYKKLTQSAKEGYVMVLMYTIVPIAVLTIVGLIRPMYLERYMVPIIIGGFIALGVAFSKLTESKKIGYKVLALSVYAVMLVGVFNLFQVGNYSFQRLENVRTADVALSVDSTNCIDDNMAIIFADPYTYIQFDNFFDKSGCPYYFYSTESKLGGGYAILSGSDKRIDNPVVQLDKYSELYYIYYDEPKLQMPIDMTIVSSEKHGSVTVDKYVSR